MMTKQIEELAVESGIDIIGFTHANEFNAFTLPDSRCRAPKISLPDAKSIIVTGIYIGGFTLPNWNNGLYGRTSRLYLSEFFLDIVKPLDPIIRLLHENNYKALASYSISEETTILPLKLAAIRAGFGWQGKHSLIINRKFGSFFALGGIITDAELATEYEVEKNRCMNCTICQDKCPMNALDTQFVLHKEKCLSYLLQTEPLPKEAEDIIGNRVGDCEICQEYCPWNKKHLKKPIETNNTEIFRTKIKGIEELFYLPILIKITEEEYKERFGFLNTGIPYEIFIRNVRIAYNNSVK